MQRRTFLVGAAVAIPGVAGCIDLDSDDDGSDSGGTTSGSTTSGGSTSGGGSTSSGGSTSGGSSGGSDGSSNGGSTTQTRQLVDDRREVSEDEYYRWSFDLNSQATLEYSFTVRDGPDIDVFVLDDQEMDEFQGGNRFRAYSSENGISGSDSVTLSPDSYRLVIDNTSAGNEAPPTNFDDDVADVEIEATIEG